MVKRNYSLELADNLDQLLEKMSAKTGKTKEQLIREALEAYSFFEPPNDELVLKPQEKYVMKSIICTTLDNQFNLLKSIDRQRDCSEMRITFLDGQVMIINTTSTWADVRVVLKKVFNEEGKSEV